MGRCTCDVNTNDKCMCNMDGRNASDMNLQGYILFCSRRHAYVMKYET